MFYSKRYVNLSKSKEISCRDFIDAKHKFLFY